MSEARHRTSEGLASLGLLLGLAIVISSWIVARTIREVKSQNQTIEVSGFSQKPITSDFAVWRITFSSTAPTIAEATTGLDSNRKKVIDFLVQKGAKPESLAISALAMNPVVETSTTTDPVTGQPVQTSKNTGYHMQQSIELSTPNVDFVANTAQKSSELTAQGIDCSFDPPSYYYLKMDEMKVEMLGEAARNARMRAEKLAGENKSGVGPLRAIHQGVFQITSRYSTEVSDSGVLDVTSKEKMIKATISVEYAVKN